MTTNLIIRKNCPQILAQLVEMSKLLSKISFRLSTKKNLLYLNNHINFAILYYFIKI
jgi:hypothetical protein